MRKSFSSPFSLKRLKPFDSTHALAGGGLHRPKLTVYVNQLDRYKIVNSSVSVSFGTIGGTFGYGGAVASRKANSRYITFGGYNASTSSPDSYYMEFVTGGAASYWKSISFYGTYGCAGVDSDATYAHCAYGYIAVVGYTGSGIKFQFSNNTIGTGYTILSSPSAFTQASCTSVFGFIMGGRDTGGTARSAIHRTVTKSNTTTAKTFENMLPLALFAVTAASRDPESVAIGGYNSTPVMTSNRLRFSNSSMSAAVAFGVLDTDSVYGTAAYNQNKVIALTRDRTAGGHNTCDHFFYKSNAAVTHDVAGSGNNFYGRATACGKI